MTRSGSKDSNGKTSPLQGTKELTADQLVRMSAKAVIELASGQTPPNALAHRDERVVRATDEFVDSIQDLKASQQYVIILWQINFANNGSLQKATHRREDLQGRFFAFQPSLAHSS